MDELESKECIVCGHVEYIYTNAAYCVNCGAEAKNYCTNPYCENNNGRKIDLEPYCKACPDCGGITTFNQLGYFSSCNEE